jgi:hypothetical protein
VGWLDTVLVVAFALTWLVWLAVLDGVVIEVKVTLPGDARVCMAIVDFRLGPPALKAVEVSILSALMDLPLRITD